MEDQRARVHIVVGCARCCLGDRRGLDEIQTGIGVAEAAGSVEMVVVGYIDLDAELHFFARLPEARQALHQAVELAERYGLNSYLRSARQELAAWAYVDGRWDEALAAADELIAAADAGDPDYSDAILLAMRGWMRLARGDPAGAARDTERAVELARASDLQAQAAAYCMRAAVALALGRREEADDLASALVTIGPPIVASLCSPFPTLAEVAWVFHDLGRASELRVTVLESDPIKSPWNDAARAIVDGDLVRASGLMYSIGHTASAAYAHLRAADALAAAGQDSESEQHHARAESFYRKVGATGLLRDRTQTNPANR
jgi:tetratricopeptide (TPR) repeat protein